MIEELQKFAENLIKYRTPTWNQFSEIDLYMDQVVTSVGGLLGVLSSNDGDGKGLTPNMVNNYVKDGHIKKPINKKYGKTQMVNLYLMMLFKSVLPIPLLASSLKAFESDGEDKAFYDRFRLKQDETICKIADNVLSVIKDHSDNSSELRLFALQMTAEANILRLAAEKLMAITGNLSSECSSVKTL